MLGRLRMTTEQALKEYNVISEAVFNSGNKKWTLQAGTYKATTLEKQVKRVVADMIRGSDGDELMLDFANQGGMGATYGLPSLILGDPLTAFLDSFVCAMPKANLAFPRRFRTYKVHTNASTNCKIWEAARATTAAPLVFKDIAISGPGDIKEKFIDAGIGCHNPAREVLDEAKTLFTGRPVGLLLSIGTSHTGPMGLDRTLPVQLITLLKNVATDSEATAVSLERELGNLPECYFRFNVTQGAGTIPIDEWKKMGEVLTHTKTYLGDPKVSKSLDSVVKRLCCRPSSTGLSPCKPSRLSSVHTLMQCPPILNRRPSFLSSEKRF
jgi:hypothetical protein